MTVAIVIGFLLFLFGLLAVLTRKNLIKMIIGFSIMDTGIHLIMVAIGHIDGKTAPILDKHHIRREAIQMVVDPIPSALVLTAIVIGLAVTSLMLAYVVMLYKKRKSLSIDDYNDLKW
ncbi:MAG TPA: cation:proton antiporter [candidate division Zixibacteria bacterium]|nr:cation:proton antiporter [candidate division Zixibacteria bacterium]